MKGINNIFGDKIIYIILNEVANPNEGDKDRVEKAIKS